MTTNLETPMRHPLDRTSRRSWRWPTGMILFAHGAIHLLGVWSAFDLGEVDGLGGPTLLITGLEPGEPATIAFGLLWLAAAAGLMVAGAIVAFGRPRGTKLAGVAAGISLIATVLWWNDAWIGAAVSAVVILVAALSPKHLDVERDRR